MSGLPPRDSAILRNTVSLLLATLAVGASGQLAVALPGTTVPQTAQTLFVLLVGIFLGPLRGAAAVVLFLVLGAAGLPVFAGGASGMSVLVGPTGGFLAGFVAAAATSGLWIERGWAGTFVGALGGMALAHVEILLLGWVRLSAILGPGEAFVQGVTPFLLMALLKTMLAAAVAMLVARHRAG